MCTKSNINTSKVKNLLLLNPKRHFTGRAVETGFELLLV